MHQDKKVYLFLILGLLALGVFRCSSHNFTSIDTISRNGIEFHVQKIKEPILVFENGLGPNIQTWKKLHPYLKDRYSHFFYNRHKYGNSHFPNTPRSGKEIVNNLRSLLVSSGCNPPYILIGHSAGGLYINLFARMFPDEIAGVVFIDSSHPDQFAFFRDHKPLLHNMFKYSVLNGRSPYELDIIEHIGKEIEEAGPFPDVPVQVLTASKQPFFADKATQDKWLYFQEDLAALSNLSEHFFVENSGHFIHQDQPNVLLNSIAAILNANGQP